MKEKLLFVTPHLSTGGLPQYLLCQIEYFLEKYNITVFDLPSIKKNDPVISDLEVESGDIVKITRKSPTAGEAVFYRCVVNV